MLIAVDIGNSNIVVGIYRSGSWHQTYRLATQSTQQSAAQFDLQLQEHLLEDRLLGEPIEQMVLSSVVPNLLPVWETVLKQLAPTATLTVLQPQLYPLLPVVVHNTAEIGTDLVANAVAAWHKVKGACLIVDFGTALTYTVVDAQAHLAGVAIAPGIVTAMQSLVNSTAKLPEVPLTLPESALGKDTTHAMQAGILLGYESMVAGMISRIKKEVGQPMQVVLTGGLSSVLLELHELADHIAPNLTLDGLREISAIINS